MTDQQFTATIMGQTRLSTVEEFNDILLRVNQDGSKVRLKDVAGSNWPAKATMPRRSTTVSPPRRWPSSWRPVPTRWIPPKGAWQAE